jgi:uncharacterized protein YceK
MKNLFIVFVLGITLIISGCAKTGKCEAGDTNIVGAKCNDGTSSSATGQGACSHHDGVKYWECEK